MWQNNTCMSKELLLPSGTLNVPLEGSSSCIVICQKAIYKVHKLSGQNLHVLVRKLCCVWWNSFIKVAIKVGKVGQMFWQTALALLKLFHAPHLNSQLELSLWRVQHQLKIAFWNHCRPLDGLLLALYFDVCPLLSVFTSLLTSIFPPPFFICYY